MPTRADPLKRENLPVSIAERLRRQIAHGVLKPGVQLPGHRELASMYSVSVGSVREAISMLVSEGLVATRAGRGTFVVEGDVMRGASPDRPLGRDEVAELIEAREALETHIVALAAQRATREQLVRLEAIMERMEIGVSDPALFLESDLELHMTLAESAGNRFLLQALTGIRSLLRRDLELSVEVGLRRHGDLSFAVEMHRKVLEAIKAHDSERARAAMAHVVNDNRESVLALYASPRDRLSTPPSHNAAHRRLT